MEVGICSMHVSQIEKFIWTQLGLGYTMEQIYDKHKKLWWAWAVGEQMT
jgi:hypothetical protein